MAFFFFGAWVGQRWDQWMGIIRSNAVFWALPAIVLMAAWAVFRDVGYGPLYALPTIGFVVVASALALRLQNKNSVAPLIFIGKNSIVFYATHFPSIYLIMGACKQLGLTNINLIALIALLGTLAIGFALSFARTRLWVVRRLFEGPDFRILLPKKLAVS